MKFTVLWTRVVRVGEVVMMFDEESIEQNEIIHRAIHVVITRSFKKKK
jgi:hypothetical protein